MAGTSSFDVMKIGFQTHGIDRTRQELLSVQEAATAITKSVKDALKSVGTKTMDSVERFNDVLQGYKAVVDSNLAKTTLQLESWLGSAGDFFSEKYKAATEKIAEYTIKPIQEASSKVIQRISDDILIVTTKVKGYWDNASEAMGEWAEENIPIFKDMYISIMEMSSKAADFIKKNGVFGTVSNLTSKAKTNITEYVEVLKKEYPKIAKVIEGPWLLGKVAVQSFKSVILGLPKAIASGFIKTTELIKKTHKFIKNTVIQVKGAKKALFTFGKQVKENIVNVAKLYAKITGISATWNALKKATKLTFKVTGLVALASIVADVLGDFWDFADILKDSIATILVPISRLIDSIMIELMPIIQRALLPLVDMAAVVLKDIFGVISTLMSGDLGFKELLDDVLGLMTEIGIVVGYLFTKLLRKIIPPLVEIMKTLVSSLLSMMVDILPIVFKLFSSIIPVIVGLFQVVSPLVKILMEVIKQILPIFLAVLSEGVTVLTSLVKDLIPTLMPAIKELATGLGELLIALLPILKLGIQLFTWLLKNVVGPVLIKGLTVVAKVIVNVVHWLTKAVQWMTEFGKSTRGIVLGLPKVLTEMYEWMASNTKKMLKGLWDYITSTFNQVMSVIGIDNASTRIHGIMKLILDMVMAPIDTMKAVMNSIIDVINDIIKWNPFGVKGVTLASITGVSPIPKFAAGAIVTGPVVGMVGEEGPEVVLPLKKEIIQKVVPGLINPPVVNVEFPKTMETAHGKDTVDLLARLVQVVDRAMNKPEAEAPLQRSPYKFGLEGFG